MSLSTYALVSVEELKDHLGSLSGAGKDSVLEQIIHRVTDEIENFLGRQIVTRTTADPLTRLTEYHSFMNPHVPMSELRTLEFPIIAVTTIHEDISAPPAYGSASLLVSGTDYQVIKPEGLIRRVSLGGPYPWLTGNRSIRLVYSAGYADTAAVPGRIKGIALRYAALIWGEHSRGHFGVSSASDGLGQFTRFSPAELTPALRDALVIEQRGDVFWQSGEREA